MMMMMMMIGLQSVGRDHSLVIGSVDGSDFFCL
jgi:hypothetical protein